LKKFHYSLMVGLPTGAMAVLPGASHSAMWVGGQMGGNFIGSLDVYLGFNNGVTGAFKNASVELAVLGGSPWAKTL